jgi:hypothetical protein
VFRIGFHGCHCDRCIAIDAVEWIRFSIALSMRNGCRFRVPVERLAHITADVSQQFPGIIAQA